MKDSPTHELFNGFNSKKRTDVTGALQSAISVNMRLAEGKYITEPEASRDNISEVIFNKMTSIENILNQSSLSCYLKQCLIAKNTELQSLKTELRDKANAQKEDEIVNDIIGG